MTASSTRDPLACVLPDVLRPASICGCYALRLATPITVESAPSRHCAPLRNTCALSEGYGIVTKLLLFHHLSLISCCRSYIPPSKNFIEILRILYVPGYYCTHEETKAKSKT